MAVRTGTKAHHAGNTITILVEGLLNGDTMKPIDISDYPDKTFNIIGTAGAGGSITLYGSNFNADTATAPGDAGSGWIALQDNLGNAATKTSFAAGDVIVENYRLLSAKVTAGDGTTDLDLCIHAAKGVR